MWAVGQAFIIYTREIKDFAEMLRFSFFLLDKSLRSANFFISDTKNIEDVRQTKKRRSENIMQVIIALNYLLAGHLRMRELQSGKCTAAADCK